MGTPIPPLCGERTFRLNDAVRRFAGDCDDVALRRYLHREWPLEDLTCLISGTSPMLARAGVVGISVLGGRAAVLPLVGALHHDDASIAAVAEDGLWRVWFSTAGSGVRRRLLRAAAMIEQRRHESALAVLKDVIDRNPEFAEGFHQRAIARVFHGDWAGAIGDYQRTLSLNACHFGALSGMGHAHARLGHPHEALRCYRAALRIHPRMEGLRQSIREVQPLTLAGAGARR